MNTQTDSSGEGLTLKRVSLTPTQLKVLSSLQMIQIAAAHLVFNQSKTAHVTALFISLHWLPVVACIKFKTRTLAYKTATKTPT